jgi:hypothetical protein
LRLLCLTGGEAFQIRGPRRAAVRRQRVGTQDVDRDQVDRDQQDVLIGIAVEHEGTLTGPPDEQGDQNDGEGHS